MRRTHLGGRVVVGLALLLAAGSAVIPAAAETAVPGAGADGTDGSVTTDTSAPAGSEVSTADWRQVSAGDGNHTCGVRTSGRLYCWGDDVFGQLGDGGTNTDQPAPVQVAGGATNWTSVNTGGNHTCARKTTGRLYCWGDDGSGQLGDGGTNTDQPAPVQVAGGATNWASVRDRKAHV